VQAQYDHLVDAVAGKLPKGAEHLDAARGPARVCQLRHGVLVAVLVDSPRERMSREIRCGTDMVGISPAATP
jgi:putative transposase